MIGSNGNTRRVEAVDVLDQICLVWAEGGELL